MYKSDIRLIIATVATYNVKYQCERCSIIPMNLVRDQEVNAMAIVNELSVMCCCCG
jgi:hypothetical protein